MGSIDETLSLSGRVEIEKTFISSEAGLYDLKMGYRAVLHSSQHEVFEGNRFDCIGEGSSVDEALKNLAENKEAKSRFFNREKDVEPFYSRPKKKTSIVYYSPDAWSLNILKPNNTDMKALFDDESEAIESGFWVETADSGDCISLQFIGRNNELNIDPLELAALSVRGKAIFYGQFMRLPHRRDAASNIFRAVGAKNHLSKILMNQRLIENQDVSEIVRYIAKNVFPKTITVNDDKIRGEGANVELFFMSHRPVKQIFDDLAFKLPDSAWGVDAKGEFFFYYDL